MSRTPRFPLSKRCMDLALSLAFAPLWLPLLGLVALLVRLRLGPPVLFRQQRPGLGGEPFMLVKFRTMTEERDGQGRLKPDEARLIRFGRFLRSTSLDELPELLLVLAGRMSLVGPRPLLMEYLDLYTPEQARRHELPPGITGWAQVGGRNVLDWPEVFRRDVWYIDNYSILLDLKILGMTVLRVLGRHGISQEGHATREKFKGGA